MGKGAKKTYAELLRFAKWLGIRVQHVRKPAQPYYTGKTLRIELGRAQKPNGPFLNFLTHEISHWVVATPEERLMPEFGLGSPGLHSTPLLSDRDPDDVEELAGVYGCFLRHAVDRVWSSELDPFDAPSLLTTTFALIEAGHIDIKGVPTLWQKYSRF